MGSGAVSGWYLIDTPLLAWAKSWTGIKVLLFKAKPLAFAVLGNAGWNAIKYLPNRFAKLVLWGLVGRKARAHVRRHRHRVRVAILLRKRLATIIGIALSVVAAVGIIILCYISHLGFIALAAFVPARVYSWIWRAVHTTVSWSMSHGFQRMEIQRLIPYEHRHRFYRRLLSWRPWKRGRVWFRIVKRKLWRRSTPPTK